MKRLLAAAILAAALTGCAGFDRGTPPTPKTSPPTTIVCQEDDACWDCNSMGNNICGPR